ncbi:MAG TPA: asparagine synthase (glutamine-hydrolyzing) [Magnetospirillum sp.]|nr:asparagine synthase (glutamine-hydrolyzing) [Magnetospirillum sp.]
MCGITGFWTMAGGGGDLGATVAAMADTIRHRGPDDQGIWTDAEAGLALAHRRLSILDLSPAGHQPMIAADGRWVMVFNGEIYNFRVLRAELEAAGAAFRGHSDTEVILEGFARWGIEPTLARLEGMYAIALWDRRDRALTLARDPLGIKPLYWRAEDGLVLFGSELKALAAHAGWRRQIDRHALARTLALGYVPAPLTIWDGVHKLEPGHMVTLRAGQPAAPRPFWRLRELIGRTPEQAWGETEAIDRLETLLKEVVGEHMVADVPLGAFLSGGIDSSTVVALMTKVSDRPVKTFTIGYGEAGYDESPHAEAVARHLGTQHTTLRAGPDDALALVPRLADIYDEPFADSSQLPTLLVSHLTRAHVTVALSGDGGDEFFAGYNRHVEAQRLLPRLSRIPRPLRRLGAAALTLPPPELLDALGRAVPGMPRLLANKAHKLAKVLRADGFDGFYRALTEFWPDAGEAGTSEAGGRLADPLHRCRYLDAMRYMPDDVLTKVDRASMDASLEVRVPLLDRRVAAFAWSLPKDLLVRGGAGKHLLRGLLYRHVPRQLIERPKMGFAVPIGAWLRGPLRDWAEDLLSKRALVDTGLADAALVRAAWADHLAGRGSWDHHLWVVLMVQAWARRWQVAG